MPARLISQHLKNSARWETLRSSDRKTSVPLNPPLARYTALFFHTDVKIAVDNHLLAPSLPFVVLTSDPEVLWARLSSTLVGRFRVSFVVREKSFSCIWIFRFSLIRRKRWFFGSVSLSPVMIKFFVVLFFRCFRFLFSLLIVPWFVALEFRDVFVGDWRLPEAPRDVVVVLERLVC